MNAEMHAYLDETMTKTFNPQLKKVTSRQY